MDSMHEWFDKVEYCLEDRIDKLAEKLDHMEDKNSVLERRVTQLEKKMMSQYQKILQMPLALMKDSPRWKK